jgi:hypothetical protein
MKYRDHRGGLSESMETEQEVRTAEDIIKHLNKFWHQFEKEVEEIKFEHVGYDKRTKWNTYYVMSRLKGETVFDVAGMSDGDLKGTKMEPTKEMIEEIKYMAETGECNASYKFCITCPLDTSCEYDRVDKILQTSAKNWLKENGVK